MADDSDQTLLRAYVRDHCEASFGELVHRHVDFVHSIAQRIVREPSLAEDVTQRVFLALARHAGNLQERTSLVGWLHETARNAAINNVRSEERRRQREQEAAMNPSDDNGEENVWAQIAPHLDDALAQLSSAERDVILWRYFERRTAEQIGGRLGVTADAAQKRVARTLDHLRGILSDRNLALTTGGLAALLSAQAVQSAPVGLAAAAIAAASAAGPMLSSTSILQIIMASTKAKIGLAAVLTASVATPLVLQHQAYTRLQNENSLLRAGLAAPPAAQATDTDGSELERLRGEHRELIQLRGQVAQLRRQVADQPKASANPTGKGRDRADDPKNSFESENAQKLLAKSPEIPMIPAHEFTYSGYATPQDSLRTITWASAKRDTNAMLGAIGLEPEARTRADELFAQLPAAVREKYATVDALLVDWRMNLAEPPEAYRVLSQREQGPDAMVLTVQFQYPNTRMRENDLTFYRDQDGVWRNAMPSGVMDKLPGVAESLMQAARK